MRHTLVLPPKPHPLSTQTLAAPLLPRRAAATTISTKSCRTTLALGGCATSSSPSPLAWLGEALLVEIVIITTTPSCC